MITFLGQNAISLSTQKTARARTTTSLAVLIILFTDLPISELKVLEMSAPVEALSISAIISIAFLFIGHAVSWYSDHLSFSKWNIGMPRVEGEFKITKATQADTVEFAFHHLHDLDGEVRRTLDFLQKLPSSQHESRNPSAELEELLRLFNELEQKFEKFIALKTWFTKVAKFEIYVWYLAVPCSLAIWAWFELIGLYSSQ